MKTPRILLHSALAAAALFTIPPIQAGDFDSPPVAHADKDMAKKHVTGSVSAKSAADLTIKDKAGDVTVVLVTGSTKYEKDGRDAKADEIKVGQFVHASVSLNKDGKLEADKVSIIDSSVRKH